MKMRGIKMKNKAFIIAMICLTIICISPIFIGQWLIQRQAEAEIKYNPPQANATCTCAFPTGDGEVINNVTQSIKYDEKSHSPDVVAVYGDIYGDDFTYTWKEVEYATSYIDPTSNMEVKVSTNSAYAGIIAGTHYYTITDNVTGQTICQNHPYTIGKATVTISNVQFPRTIAFVDSTNSLVMSGTLTALNKVGSFTYNIPDSAIKDFSLKSSSVAPVAQNVSFSSYNTTDLVKIVYGDNYTSNATYVHLVKNNYAEAIETKSVNVLPTTYAGDGNSRVYYSSLMAALGKRTTADGTAIAAASGKVYPMPTVTYNSTTYSVKIGANSTSGRYTHTITENCTIPSGMTLIIPYDIGVLDIEYSDGLFGIGASAHLTHATVKKVDSALSKNNLFLSGIKVADNVTFENKGTIYVLGVVSAGNGGGWSNSLTTGNHSRIVLGSNAHLKNSGGKIYCYGYITEETLGTSNNSSVDIESGQIQVVFSIVEHRGGTVFGNIAGNLQGAPFNQFFVESVTTNMTVTEGASVMSYGVLYAGGTFKSIKIPTIGNSTDNFFSFSTSSSDPEATKIVMRYNYATKQNEIDIYGSASIQPIALDLGMGDPMGTADVYLPLSHYWNIRCHVYQTSKAAASITSTTQAVKLLPGSSMTIDKNVSWTATAVAVYSKDTPVPAAGSFTYPSTKDAVLVVNGSLIAGTLGGKVTTQSSGSIVKITGSHTAEVMELDTNSSDWKRNILPAEGLIYNYNGAQEGALVKFNDESYTSNGTAWVGPTSNYQLTYSYKVLQNNQVSQFDQITPIATSYSKYQAPVPQSPMVNGYQFNAWYWDADCTQEIDTESLNGLVLFAYASVNDSSVVIYGLYEPRMEGQITISLNIADPADGGQAPTTTITAGDLNFNAKISETPTISIANQYNKLSAGNTTTSQMYYFDGWYTDDTYADTAKLTDNMIDLATNVDGVVNVYGRWLKKHTLTTYLAATGTWDNYTAATVTVTHGSSSTSETLESSKSEAVWFNTVYLMTNDTVSVSQSGGDSITVNGGNTTTFTITGDLTLKISVALKGSNSDDCLAEGTLITMADGSKKPVEDIRKGDLVMAFDHLTGQITHKEVIIVIKIECDYIKNTFIFDDGTELATINEHGIFDLDLNKYVNIDNLNYEQYLGHRFVSIDSNGNIGVKTLIDVTTVYESGYKYDIVTNGTLNYVAEDTLSVTHVLVDIINTFDFGDNLMYDHEKMMADIAEHGLYTFDDWDEYLTLTVFEQYNVAVMHVGVSKGLYTRDYLFHLLYRYVNDDSLQLVE